MKRYPILSLQIIYYQIDQMHKLNSFKNGIFVFTPYGIMLKFTGFQLKNDMVTSKLRFIFGKGLSEAS